MIVEVAPSGCEVDGERPKLENRVGRWGNRATAKMRPEAGEQHGQAERFDEIVISARVEADDDVDLAAAGGKNDEQGFRIVAADGASQIDTVKIGKAKVQQHNFGRVFMDVDERGGASAAPGGRIAVAFETKMEMVSNSGIVFDNQHCRERELVRPAHAASLRLLQSVSLGHMDMVEPLQSVGQVAAVVPVVVTAGREVEKGHSAIAAGRGQHLLVGFPGPFVLSTADQQ